MKKINRYKKMQERQIEQYYELPMIHLTGYELENIFASKDERKIFEEDMEKLGLKPNETDKLYKIDLFTYIRKDQLSEYNALMENMEKEINDAIDKDTDGNGFVKDMFKCGISELLEDGTLEGKIDTDEILYHLGITEDEFKNKDNLKKGLELAKRELEREKIEETEKEKE